MNICFEILLPRKMDLSVISLHEQFITWGDEVFSQEPPVWAWEKKLYFKLVNEADLFRRVLGELINLDSYFVFTLIGDSFDSWQYLVNTQQDISDNPLVRFIKEQLLKLNDWIIVTSVDDEQIDECIKLEQKDDVISILCESIDWSIGKGLALIYKQ